MKKKDILIVGGGIVGLCCAHYLLEAGHKVRLAERGDLSDGCSFGNAGIVAESHVVPLSAPGALAQGIRWMFQADSPFYIRPRFSWKLMRWGRRFIGAGTAVRMRAAVPLLYGLNTASRREWERLAALPGIDCGFTPAGLVVLYRTPAGADAALYRLKLAQEAGLEAYAPGPEELKALNPEVDLSVTGGVYYPGDAHLDPAAFMRQFISYLQERGLTIIRNAEVMNFGSREGRILSAETAKESLKAEEFVLAAGSWTAELCGRLGIRLVMLPGKGYAITLEEPPQAFRTPALLSESKVAATPLGQQLRFSGTLEIGSLRQTVNSRRLDGIRKAVPPYLSGYRKKDVAHAKAWSGLRPCSPDGLPYIGRPRKFRNLVIATGHGMLGLTQAPVTGQIVTALCAGEPHPLATEQLHPNRY